MALFNVQDDSGDAVRLAPMWRFVTPSVRDDLAPDQRGSLRQRVGLPLAISAGIVTACVLVLLTVVVVLAVATGSRIFGLVFHTPVQAAGIGMAITLGGLIRIAWRAHAARAERETLRVGACPSCLYPLSDVRPVDGMTTCPECASRWRSNRIGVDPRNPAPPRVIDDQLNARASDHASEPEQTTAAIGGGPRP